MTVRCCRTYEEVHDGDIGRVVKLDRDGLHDLNVQVDWQRKGGTYWVRYIHVELLSPPLSLSSATAAAAAMLAGAASSSSTAVNAPTSAAQLAALISQIPIKIGDRVRVKPTVTTPKYKWGTVNHASVGVVVNISANGRDVAVDFPQQNNWTGLLAEMELVPTYHPGVTCDECKINPIAGSRFKCKVTGKLIV